jgi:tetratricopeptide (TPR) repeat protein
VLERSAELCETAKLQVILTTTTALLGLARALQGHFRDALPAMEKNEARAPEIRIFNTSTATIALGTVRLLAGKADEATELAAHAAESAAEHGFRGSQARISHLLGDIYARRDRPDVERADQHYRQALAFAEELGMRPLVAQCHLGLGKLHRQATHLKQAAEQFRDMNMPFWLQQAKAQLEKCS